MPVVIGKERLTIDKLVRVARNGEKALVSPEAIEKINRCRAFVEKAIEKREVMYGVTTGIGQLAEVVLSPEEAAVFQKYLIYSHSAGVGEPMEIEEVRGAILHRINVNAAGLSGIRWQVISTLAEMLDRGVTPVVPRYGSVGACGDLAPMAHIALVVIGEGEAFFDGERLPGGAAMKKAGIEPIELRERDGLAFINGCCFIASVGGLALFDLERLVKTSEIAAAMSLEASLGQPLALDERLHRARGFDGSIKSAKNIARLTEGSELLYTEKLGKKRVQDAYSLRSSPQIAGAAKDTVRWAKEQIEIELNGVGDNPLFFPEDGDFITGANFQGTPIAIPIEAAAVAATTVAVISERRINRLLDPALSRGLPAFLTEKPGIMSGFMIAQYTADALITECRILCSPAAILSIPAATEQEDFVSMGMASARKLRNIVEHFGKVVAIEILCAAQALDYRKGAKPGAGTAAVLETVRDTLPFREKDRPLYIDIEKAFELVRAGALLSAAESVVGRLD